MMNKEEQIQKLEQIKSTVKNPALQKDIEDKIKKLSNDKPVEK